jgi:acyl-CoA synthetase (AMP-forming)/AMP-acid ligase II
MGEPVGVDAAVRSHANATPNGIAVLSDQGILTWAELDRRADWLANGIRRAGVNPGDYVAWLGRNRYEFPIFIVAARRARAVVVGLNWRLASAELTAIIADCTPKLILTESELAPLIARGTGEGGVSQLVYLDNAGERASFAQLLASGHDALPALLPDPKDPVFLYYTSGTTGKPKGVLHGLARTDAAVTAETPFGWGPDSITLIVAPVFHLTGSVWTQSSLVIGAQQVVSASTSAALILSAIERWRVTHAVLVPTMIRMLLTELQNTDVGIDSLQIVTYGGAPMTQPLLREAMTHLKCRFAQGYGLTETNCPATFLNPEDHVLEGPRTRLLGSVGRGYAGIEIRVADPATGRVLGAGEVGEVQIRTPWRMLGYRNEPAMTAAVLDDQGWFRSGDGGYLDDEGYLFLTDRINDMIITGGENVMPSEVENVLASHAAVVEAAVFGVNDPVWGETIVAAVVVRSGQQISKDELIQYSRARMAHYKCPKEIVVVDELPRSATGKVLRRELRVRFKRSEQLGR